MERLNGFKKKKKIHLKILREQLVGLVCGLYHIYQACCGNKVALTMAPLIAQGLGKCNTITTSPWLRVLP